MLCRLVVLASIIFSLRHVLCALFGGAPAYHIRARAEGKFLELAKDALEELHTEILLINKTVPMLVNNVQMQRHTNMVGRLSAWPPPMCLFGLGPP